MKPHNIELMSIIIPFSNIKMGDFQLSRIALQYHRFFWVLLLRSEREELDPPQIQSPSINLNKVALLPSSEE